MRLRVAKKVAKRHSQGARYRQSTLSRASSRLKLPQTERMVRHLILDVPLAVVPVVKDTVSPPAIATDYAKMTATALKALAKEQGLKGYSKLKKAELIELLS